MKRGDIVTVALQGDYGKPRPAVIIQNDILDTVSVVILPITSHLIDADTLRVAVALKKQSQVMVDKPATVNRDKIGQVIGKLDKKTLKKVESGLMILMGIGC